MADHDEAMPLPDPDPTPQGHGRAIESPWYVRLTPADMGLLRRAARRRWGVPDEIKSLALMRLGEILATTDTEHRDWTAAARTLAAFDRIDQADARLDFAREALALKTARPEAEVTLSDLVAEAEAAAEAHAQSSPRPPEAHRSPGTLPGRPEPLQ